MKKFTLLKCSHSTKENIHSLTSLINRFLQSVFVCFLLSLSNAYGQDANIDQIRNSNLYGSPFVNTATWVNGNANASQAHYMESHSIGYRSLLTGLVTNNSYTYYISYETEVSSIMAIDYLTHFQRLEPHGPFGHTAETVNPRILLKGSTPYVFQNAVTTSFLIPKPTPTGSPVTGQPGNSWQSLFNQNQDQLKMTGYDATITNIQYRRQDDLNSSATKVTSSIAVTFTANNDSAILAWGGHIASRLDWGFLPNSTTPRSAAGISGSPYHMRNDSIKNNTTGVNKGLGATDRQLSAAAVIPPPNCAISAAQTFCPEQESVGYSYTESTTGKTFQWSINANNTAGAQISGSTTGASISVVPTGTDFIGGGTFTVSLVVTQNGIPSEPCTQTGTVNPNPTASAGTAPAAQCQDVTNGNTFSLSGSGTNGTPSWAVQTNANNLGVQITGGNTFTPSVNVTGGTGSVTLRLTVTSAACGTATSDVTLQVKAQAVATDGDILPILCTDIAFKLKLKSPVEGTTYTVTQPCNSAYSSEITAGTGDVIFEGLKFGAGYKIVASINGGCAANPIECGGTTCTDICAAPGAGSASKVSNARLGKGTIDVVDATIQSKIPTKVLAAPNPFNDRIRFSLQSDVSGRGSLELYNMQGQMIKVLYQGEIQKGVVKTIEYSVPGSQRQNLIYVFRVGDQKITGKLIGPK